jgi:class 3 adenylate cyclase
MTDIGAWLSTLGLGQFADLFRNNLIDVDVLPDLSEADLETLGLPLGARKKIIKAASSMVAVAGLATAPKPLERIAAPAATGTAERRQLTVMFVDLVGSTALSARLDPEEMGAVLRAYQNAVAGEVARFEGHVAKFMGDGVLAYFGWPVAHEDEAERAVRAGLAVRDAVAQLTGGEAPLACRIGLATGLVVVGELIGEGVAQEQTVVGDTPNLAARLQALAAPGQVVVGEATRRLLGTGFLLDDLGAQALKGIAGAVSAFAVTGERVLASRFEGRATGLQPMVGRDQELALLLERWAQAEAGEGQAVLLVGEAGVGKSRISRGLLDALGERPHIRIRYQCSPYHTGSALWPAIQQLEHAAGFAADDSLETKLDKLEAELGGERASESTALIAGLVGLDGTARYGALELAPAVLRARTLEALVRRLLQLAASRPVLLLVEDAHWADPTTLELVEAWLDAIATARVLLVLTSRPDNQPALAAHPHVTRLSLNRLGRAGVEAIVARLGGDRLPPATVDAIIARTDGVPLFVEELTKAVLESGVTAIPASLHDSLMARLDRVPEVKEVAQIAACIGREFDHALLAAVADRPTAELSAALDKLGTAELVFRRGTPPDARYTFKHALVRDAAYESLLKSRRQALHGRILGVLEAGGAPAELLALHAGAGGEVGRAVGWWRRAGEAAVGRAAFDEAAAHLAAAQALLPALAERATRQREEAGIAITRAQASLVRHGYGHEQTKNLYAAADALAEAADDPRLLLLARYGVWAAHHVREEVGAALGVAAQMVDEAGRRQDLDLTMMAHRMLATSQTMAGRLDDAQGSFERARALYDPACHRELAIGTGIDPLLGLDCYQALAMLASGHLDQASALADAAREASEGFEPTINARSYGLFHVALAEALTRESAKAGALAEGLAALARARGLSFWEAMAGSLVAWARVDAGDPAGAITAMSDSLVAAEAAGSGLLMGLLKSVLAEALAVTGDTAALAMAEAAEALAHRSGGLYALAEIQRRQGVVLRLLRPAATAEAEAAFRRALATAAEQKARLWELRAAGDLARLLADQGRHQEALDLLAPVYGWFTEGFDLPDLVEAEALLEALG